MTGPTKRFGVVVAAGLSLAMPSVARAQDDPEPSLALLSEALSCRSREALEAFGDRLFLQNSRPEWMRRTEPPKALDGMIGLYGFAVEGDVTVFGEPVDHVYFLKEWVVALLPRATVDRTVRAEKLERVPVAMTEQHFRFVDPEVGPMIGAFAPTGDAMEAMLLEAFGGGAASQPAVKPPAGMLLVGCNYAVASQADFLTVARSAEEMIRKIGADLRRTAQ